MVSWKLLGRVVLDALVEALVVAEVNIESPGWLTMIA